MRGLVRVAFVIFAAALAAGTVVGGGWPRGQIAQARQPTPQVIRGIGARVVSVRLPRSSPLVVGATHTGSANFVIRLVGSGGEQLLVNEIGRYSGEVAYADARAGSYRIAIEADGNWVLYLSQPTASASARNVPTTLAARGSKVVQIRTRRDGSLVFTVRHTGQSNFVVYLIGLSGASGHDLVVNEIGRYSGQQLVDSVPKGTYLVAVQADGYWTARITP